MSLMERLAARTMLLDGWRRAAAGWLAGASAVLALPPFDFFAAMFIAFPVLVWLLDGAAGNPDRGFLARLWPAFTIGWWFGFGYFTAGLWWLGGALLVEADDFAWALPFAVFGLPACLAVFYGAAAAFARALWSDGLGRILALAAAFALMEWLRGTILTGFPWNAIGYGAMPVPVAMQSARFIGLGGVTALAVIVFSTPALFGTRHGVRPGIALAAALVVAHIGYGTIVLMRAPDAEPDGRPVVRIVQPSIAQSAKWSPDERDAIFAAHLELSAEPPRDGEATPDLILWPETAVPFILTEEPAALRAIADMLEDGQRLAAGAVRIDDSRRGEAVRYYNSITVIDGSGEIVTAADKVHLVPFGEYLPLETVLGRFGLSTIAETYAGFTAASERRALDLGAGITALPLICYEAIFPLDPEALDIAPDVIVNITNDAWYGATPGPYQHFRQAQVRAVEAGLPMIRAANNGLSAVTDAHGRIVAGLPLDAVGVLDVALPAKAAPSWDKTTRDRNLWLLIGMLLVASGIARTGFIRR